MRRLPPLVGILDQTTANQPLKRRRRQRLPCGDRLRLGRQDRSDETRFRFAFERALAGGHLIEHCAEGEDVGTGVDFSSFELLGRHVLERPDQHPLLSKIPLFRAQVGQRGENPARSWFG